MRTIDRVMMHRLIEALAVPHVREMRLVEGELAREAIAAEGAAKVGPVTLRPGWLADVWRLPDGSLLRVEAYEEDGPGVALWARGMPADHWTHALAADALSLAPPSGE